MQYPYMVAMVIAIASHVQHVLFYILLYSFTITNICTIFHTCIIVWNRISSRLLHPMKMLPMVSSQRLWTPTSRAVVTKYFFLFFYFVYTCTCLSNFVGVRLWKMTVFWFSMDNPWILIYTTYIYSSFTWHNIITFSKDVRPPLRSELYKTFYCSISSYINKPSVLYCTC